VPPPSPRSRPRRSRSHTATVPARRRADRQSSRAQPQGRNCSSAGPTGVHALNMKGPCGRLTRTPAEINLYCSDPPYLIASNTCPHSQPGPKWHRPSLPAGGVADRGSVRCRCGGRERFQELARADRRWLCPRPGARRRSFAVGAGNRSLGGIGRFRSSRRAPGACDPAPACAKHKRGAARSARRRARSCRVPRLVQAPRHAERLAQIIES
jgi:hypothetical protein